MTPASRPSHLRINPHQAFQAAIALEDQGRPREAERLYEYALALSPDHVASLLRLSTLRVQQADLAGALELLRRATDVAPQSADAQAALGRLLAALDGPQEAIACYRKAIAIKPDNAAVHHHLANALRTLRRGEEAIDHYQRAVTLAPNLTEAHSNLAGLLAAHDRPEEAIIHYQHTLAIKPDDVEAHQNLGMVLQATGRLEEALAHYEQALTITPDRVDVRIKIGDILHALGRSHEAIAHYQKALVRRPDDPQAHNNLGICLAALERHDEAVAHYNKALAITPNAADVHANLGSALHARGRAQDAVKHYHRALELAPENAAAHNNLGNVLSSLDRHEDAIAHYQRALVINPGFAQAHCNAGIALAALDRREEAIAHFRQALTIRPGDGDAHCRLADQLVALDRLDEAIAHYRTAHAIRPDAAEICCGLANALQQRGQFEESIEHYTRALAIRPDSAEAHNNLGNSLLALNRNEEAIAQFEATLAINPAAEAQNNIGVALQALGRLDAAAQAYEAAVRLAPGRAAIHLNLAHSKSIDAAQLAALEALAQDQGQRSHEESIALQFALAKAYDDRNEPERGFRHLIAGNALKRRHLRYDEPETLALFERIRTVFTADLLASKAGSGDPRPLPVFIVGMPRSGTTLVEQILASHSKVFGAGEREDLGTAIAAWAAQREAFPERVAGLSPQELRQFGANYIATVSAAAPTAERFVDKMPINFLYIGLIHLTLANARIIHVRRDPLDTCFSCFSMLFVGNQPYTYELGELGRYYRAYEALMAHWRQVLPPGVMIEVRYEDIIDDLKGQAAAMVAHCGLAFEESCLAFHETIRPVRTASSTQVRQALYRRSVGRARAYEHLLKPLCQALADKQTP